MPFSGMLCYVALVRTEVSKEHSSSIIRVTRISGLGMLAVTSSPILVSLMEVLHFSETPVLTRATRRNIPEMAFFIVTTVKTSNPTLTHQCHQLNDRHRIEELGEYTTHLILTLQCTIVD
jgi:hypothetical protein